MKKKKNKTENFPILCWNFAKRNAVWLYWMGWHQRFTPQRYPITVYHEDFWLLGFPPGPVRLSLANLHTSDSSIVRILMVNLMRTPCQHEPSDIQISHSQISPQTRPPRSRITEAAKLPVESICVNCECYDTSKWCIENDPFSGIKRAFFIEIFA